MPIWKMQRSRVIRHARRLWLRQEYDQFTFPKRVVVDGKVEGPIQGGDVILMV